MSAPADPMPALLARIPYTAFLGLRGDLLGDELTVVMPYAETLIGNPLLPALHGGVIGALMEITAVLQLALVGRADLRLPKPIDISVEYLRSGRPRDTFARARIKRLGRRVANVQVEAWQEARAHPIAALHGNFLLAQPQTDAPSTTPVPTPAPTALLA